MPATRLQVAADVGNVFLPAKLKAKDAAVASYEALAIMIEARSHARMPDPNFGADILERFRRAADHAFEAQALMHEVHGQLAPIREAWKVPPGAYGPDDTAQDPKRAMVPFTTAEAGAR